MNLLIYCLFAAVYAHGPDASFDELDAFHLHRMQSVRDRYTWQGTLAARRDYTIHVSLDPDTKKITGRESIVYK